MFSNLFQTLGRIAEQIFPPVAAFGGFSLKRDVFVGLTDGNKKLTRDYVSEEDFTAVGNIPVRLIEPVNDPRGFNVSMIGQNGYVTAELFSQTLALATTISRAHISIIANAPELYMRCDSQISLIVAMLSSYYVLVAQETGQVPCLRSYDDGHIKLDLLNLICPQPDNEKMFADEPPQARIWRLGATDDEPDLPTLYLGGVNHAYADLILWHLSGRKKTTRYAFDLEIPQLAANIFVSGYEVNQRRIPDLANVTANMVRGALNQYVASNRLQAAFEVAYALYQQIALTPLPDHAEGYAWLLRKRVLELPSFDAFRGAYRSILLGEPFGITGKIMDSVSTWKNHGLGIAVQGAMFTSLSMWGRYFAEGGFYHPDASVRNRLGEHNVTDAPGSAYYAYAALISGDTTYCPIPPAVGIRYEAWNDEFLAQLPVTVLDVAAEGYNLIETRSGNVIEVTQVPTPCSAVSVIGRMPRNSAFSCLSDHFTVKFKSTTRGWVLPDMNNAWGFAIVARWFGHNVEMVYDGVTKIANWAPNCSSIAARPFYVAGHEDIETVRINNVSPRRKVWRVLPIMGVGDHEWHADVSVCDMVTVCRHDGRRICAIGAHKPMKLSEKTSITVNSTSVLSYAAINIQPTDRQDVRAADFHIMGPDSVGIPPDPPAIVDVEPPPDPGGGPEATPERG